MCNSARCVYFATVMLVVLSLARVMRVVVGLPRLSRMVVLGSVLVPIWFVDVVASTDSKVNFAIVPPQRSKQPQIIYRPVRALRLP